ncbi:hypothetical protein U9M48_003873 [Paspalum notatum var. saurae]|uniref:Uncharacterized protein n=2 Tax=Paspalum notatum var. saurae TaxID=547442 RepID=A0AAQ3SK87_PASNO
MATPSPSSHEEIEGGKPPGHPSPAHGAPSPPSTSPNSKMQNGLRTTRVATEEVAPMIPDDIQGCSPTTQRVLPSSLVISPGHHRKGEAPWSSLPCPWRPFSSLNLAQLQDAKRTAHDKLFALRIDVCEQQQEYFEEGKVNFVRLRTANRVDPNLILETRATIDRMQEQNLMYYNWKRFFPNYKELLRYALSFVKF